MNDVVRVNVYLKNIADLDTVNEVYGIVFPVLHTNVYDFAVADLLLEGAHLQMDTDLELGEGIFPQDARAGKNRARNDQNAPSQFIVNSDGGFLSL